MSQCSPSMACAVVMLVSSSACARLCPGPLAGDGPPALAGRLPRPGGGCVPMPCMTVGMMIRTRSGVMEHNTRSFVMVPAHEPTMLGHESYT